MTEEQYWDRDCTLVVSYRKADELRRERENTLLWLQGRYVYDALLAVAPVLHAFAKKGTKPSEYVKEPYPITSKDVEDVKEKRSHEAYQKNKVFFETFMVKNNLAFEQKENGGEIEDAN